MLTNKIVSILVLNCKKKILIYWVGCRGFWKTMRLEGNSRYLVPSLSKAFQQVRWPPLCNLTVHGIVKKKLFLNRTLFSSHFQSFSLSPTLSPSFPSPWKLFLSLNISFWALDWHGTDQRGGSGWVRFRSLWTGVGSWLAVGQLDSMGWLGWIRWWLGWLWWWASMVVGLV